VPDKRPGGHAHAHPAPTYGAPPAPTYGAPAPTYGSPAPAPAPTYLPSPPPTYGKPAPQCYPKVVTKTMTKDVQGTSMNYGTKYKKTPSTIYAQILETVVAPKTVILYSTMTAYAEPQILTETKVLYDTKLVTEHKYHKETKYGYNTAQQYFTETKGIYVTKTETAKYPLTNSVTNVNIKTNAYYVTQTKVQPQYQTITINNPYYVTQTVVETKYEQVYHTKNVNVQSYATQTVWVDVPEYHTVTKCPQQPGYSVGGANIPNGPTYPAPAPAPVPTYTAPKPQGYPAAKKPMKGYGY